MNKEDPRFDDCIDCKYYRKRNSNPICKGCGSGEFFEARLSSLRAQETSFNYYNWDEND